jgi:hypothetical protein
MYCSTLSVVVTHITKIPPCSISMLMSLKTKDAVICIHRGRHRQSFTARSDMSPFEIDVVRSTVPLLSVTKPLSFSFSSCAHVQRLWLKRALDTHCPSMSQAGFRELARFLAITEKGYNDNALRPVTSLSSKAPKKSDYRPTYGITHCHRHRQCSYYLHKHVAGYSPISTEHYHT